MTDDPLAFDNLFGSMRGAEFAPSDYEQGERDMLAKCIEAVEAMHIHGSHPFEGIIECNCVGPQVVAVLQALQEKP